MDCIDEKNKDLDRELKELKEQSRKLYIELYGEPKEINITDNELKEIRKRVEKVLLKTSATHCDAIAHIFNVYELMETEEDYKIYSNMSEKEYNEILKEYKENGRTKKELNRCIKEEYKYFNEVKIMKYRFKEKYSWKNISQEVGLSDRQCQRIKDKILNKLIISWLIEENYFISRCRDRYY